MGFTKLDSGIVDSSVWSEVYPTRVVWVTFLAKADAKGIVRASQSGMKRASNVTQDEFDIAIKCLEGPDPDSRSPEHDGRRIQKIDGGWLVLNYQKYRMFSYSNSPEAIRQRKHREKDGVRDTPLHVTKGRDISASASVLSSLTFKEGIWSGIADKDRETWGAAFPACDVNAELRKMASWLVANPSKKKSNYRRFIHNWLTRAQDAGGTKGVPEKMEDRDAFRRSYEARKKREVKALDEQRYVPKPEPKP